MKKHLTILSFAMTMMMAFTASFTLTSCGEEVDIDGVTPPGKTVFSAGLDGTRTTIGKQCEFYWQANDQIWVKDGSTWLKSSDSQTSTDQTAANFYYDKLLTASSYQVVYTGYGSTSATKVTIPADFTTTLNGSNEIGLRGDCGVATATKQSDGTYTFVLAHKPSYLGVAPLVSSYLTSKTYKWTKIEIADVNGKAIAGTFGFSTAGIDTTSVTSPSSKITLKADANSSTYLQSSSSADIAYNFTVIPPCYRELKVTYYFVNAANTADTIKWSKQMNARKFIENNVAQFYHAITPDYYRWDAPMTEPYATSNPNRREVGNLTKAINSCATMPNPNEIAWYVHNGDPRWDGTTKWTLNGVEYTGGVWIKKKANITGFSSTADPDGVDRRTTFRRTGVQSATYQTGGKPTNTNQYFFVPALGLWNGADFGLMGQQGWYWSSYSGEPVASYQNEAYMGYCLNFNSNSIAVQVQRSRHGCIAGNGSDWFK